MNHNQVFSESWQSSIVFQKKGEKVCPKKLHNLKLQSDNYKVQAKWVTKVNERIKSGTKKRKKKNQVTILTQKTVW